MSKIEESKLIDAKVNQKIFPTIERGRIQRVSAIFVHQTGSRNAASTFPSRITGMPTELTLPDRQGTSRTNGPISKKEEPCLQRNPTDDDSIGIEIFGGGPGKACTRIPF